MVQFTEIFKILNKALVFAVIITSLSFLINIVPCQVGFNDFINDGFCKLPNPFKELNSEATSQFYWTSTNPLTGLVLQFLVSLILFSIVYIIIKRKSLSRKKQKVIDFTKK